MKFHNEEYEKDNRHFIVRGRELIEQIVDVFRLKFVSAIYCVAIKTVACWCETTNSPLVHTYQLIKEVRDYGHPELAHEIVRYLCDADKCIPIKRGKSVNSFVSLLRSFAVYQDESSDISKAFSAMIADGVAEIREIELNIHEVDELLEAANRFRNKLEELRKQAESRNGQVVIDLHKRETV